MNKKFSTLVAVLLAAGAWNTLDAEVVKITSPKVGGSYLIGSSIVEGDENSGKVGDLLQVADATSINGLSTAITDFTNVWTFESTGEAGEFFLTDGTKYLSAATSGDATLTIPGNATNAVKFKLVGNKIVVTGANGANSGNSAVAADMELKLNAGAIVTLVAAEGGSTFEFGVFNKDLKVTSGNQYCHLQTAITDGEYYFISGDGGTNTLKDDGTEGAPSFDKTAASNVTSGNVANYLWKVVSVPGTDGKVRYKFINLNSGNEFAVDGAREFVANDTYQGAVSLTINGNVSQSLQADFTAGGSAAKFGIYKSLAVAKTAAELNAIYNKGFSLTIKANNDKTVDGNVMAGKTLYAVTSGDNIEIVDKLADNGTAADDANCLMVNPTGWDGSTGGKAKFVWVKKADKDSKSDWYSEYQITSRSGRIELSKTEVESLIVMDGTTVVGNAYIATYSDNNYLTVKKDAAASELPSISLGADDVVKVETLLGKFYNVAFASKSSDLGEADKYKVGRVLAMVDNNQPVADPKAGFVVASSVAATSPESQWAITTADLNNNSFTLTNRESKMSVASITLRHKSGDAANVYTVSANVTVRPGETLNAGEKITLTEVKNITKYDGFMRTEPNALRNQVFNIGQYHNETGNVTAYWAENHTSDGTHKLGVVTEGGTDWKLYLDMKPGDLKNEVDTVLIITELATLKNDGTMGVTPDTLAVLPYLIQNNSNLEYVLYKGDKLNYYACDEYKDVEANAQRFALKMKPNGTYNVVTIAAQPATYAKTTSLGASKVFVGNSEQWGSLDNLNAYSKDNNSLMVVKPNDKPEYRKVAKDWGDIVRIYRDEYSTEALFEKRDAKSVVEKDTLSFLNVNNSVTGAKPGLFVDTAYVNRVDANGIANTCYQYLLGVNVTKTSDTYCPDDVEHNDPAWIEEHGVCPHAIKTPLVKGRFLINLIDTANVYGATHLHSNPYVNGIEAGEQRAKLSFVEGVHTNDTLYITRQGGEVVKLAMDSPEFNIAKFAFRYVNNADGSFKIQTRYKDYNPASTKETIEENANNNGYLKWINGTVVVEKDFINGETFNMEENYDGQAVANEDITASSISVIAKEGAVIINGAQGKKVVISNVLGQTVASTVISSDKAEISAPAGVVVVAVEGEAAVKAIVK
ncbi:DUF6383 domain-containing protein [uncultured Parabacteroides sp.]|uniref:DUF6383 domain-containing protein n=1 Tax=uncultured Parabacteroides sp. TaxID=512312 RepID=UPI00258884B3|nr:DUF6383 domain-containing protein [uncultured Parabacteroides sp.]